jgi:nucleoside-diphosphate-sugar epimerase
VPGGIYEVCDDEPVTRMEFGEVCAGAIGVPPPRPGPRWLAALAGSTGELLSRSQRISNARLKGASGWAPRWKSVREGIPEAARQIGLGLARAASVQGLGARGERAS